LLPHNGSGPFWRTLWVSVIAAITAAIPKPVADWSIKVMKFLLRGLLQRTMARISLMSLRGSKKIKICLTVATKLSTYGIGKDKPVE